ncbi:MAG TPA: PucR family transcriptional regulator ligand-binding domain-containing protein [Baekduia sp.]|nr:PucR family transcriptional regulator ligand-binding domain-containing protein [Baekduia sp.]
MSTRLASEPPMTVDAALRLPALRRGAPEVLAGAEGLERPVRWAHSCEARHIPGLLEGDELLLMTGMGLGGAAADQRAFVRDLVARRVAALVIELGHVFTVLPAPLVQEARRQRLPLIALHEEVRFVEVTRQMHTAILSRQLTVERRVTELHGTLTGMLLDGAGVPAILGALARAIGNPVLLERGGAVVFHAAGGAQAEELLAQWELLRARLDEGEAVAAVAAVTAAGGRAWGRLIAVPAERPVDALAWSAVERVAPLLALALARAGEEQLLESRERGNFLADVMSGRIEVEDMPARAARLGLPGHGRMLPIVVARGTARRGERPTFVALRDVREALRSWGIAGLLGVRPGDDVVMLMALPAGMLRETAIDHVVAAVGAATALADGRPAIAAGPIVETWPEVPDALRAAADTAETMRDGPPRAWHDATVADVERLLWGLRDDDRMTTFARQRLAPVLRHDHSRTAPLLPTLEALCAHGWHKAHTAAALGVQRQSLYARLARLQRLLDADLEDPGTRLGLDLAVRTLALARELQAV